MASEFGVIETAPDGSVIGFHEKSADAPTMPGDPDRVYASMGNYIFSTDLLLRELYADAQNPDSSHDFGRDILPSLVGRTEMFAYDFQTNRIPGDPPTQEPYWRDVGTIDAYYEANMDLRAVTPALNLYNRQWPLRTASYSDAPAKFIFDEQGPPRAGASIRSSPAAPFFPAAWCADSRARTRRARAFGRAGGGFDHLRQLRYRAARQGAARDSR